MDQEFDEGKTIRHRDDTSRKTRRIEKYLQHTIKSELKNLLQTTAKQISRRSGKIGINQELRIYKYLQEIDYLVFGLSQNSNEDDKNDR